MNIKRSVIIDLGRRAANVRWGDMHDSNGYRNYESGAAVSAMAAKNFAPGLIVLIPDTRKHFALHRMKLSPVCLPAAPSSQLKT